MYKYCGWWTNRINQLQERQIKSHCMRAITLTASVPTLYLLKLFTYIRRRKTKEAQMGDGSRWLNAEETISLQYNAMRLLSLLFFYYFSVEGIFTSRCISLSSIHFWTEVGRWTSAQGRSQCSDPSLSSHRSSKQSSGNMKSGNMKAIGPREPCDAKFRIEFKTWSRTEHNMLRKLASSI